VLTNDLSIVAPFVAGAVGCPIHDRGNAALGWLRDGEIVAGVMYEHYTGASIEATIAVAPGAVLVPGFVRVIFDYPFKQLDVNLILISVAESNWKSRNLVEKLGFVKETEVAGVYPDGAMIIYTMTHRSGTSTGSVVGGVKTRLHKLAGQVGSLLVVLADLWHVAQ